MSTPQPQRPAEAGAHSPLPWELEFDTEYGDFGSRLHTYLVGILAANEKPVLRFDDDYEHLSANAALIVTAVNERPALLARLAAAEKVAESANTALNILDSYMPISGSGRRHFQEVITEVRAALAAWEATTATGGTQGVQR